jgi:hypothetical protein
VGVGDYTKEREEVTGRRKRGRGIGRRGTKERKVREGGEEYKY